MKKLFVVLVLVVVAAGAFADDIFASYNKPGNINIYAAVGWYHYFEVTVAAEYMIGEFTLGTLPFDWGVAVRGGMDFAGRSISGRPGHPALRPGGFPHRVLSLAGSLL